jgi:signal transduction histidine kinase
LGRAIANLIDNALVHSASGPVRLDVEQRGAEVEIRVENEGQVGAHVRTRLFRRFVTTRPDRGGTGLGLAIIRAVAEAHGGRAELVEPGPPTVAFRVVLPVSWRATL